MARLSRVQPGYSGFQGIDTTTPQNNVTPAGYGALFLQLPDVSGSGVDIPSPIVWYANGLNNNDWQVAATNPIFGGANVDPNGNVSSVLQGQEYIRLAPGGYGSPPTFSARYVAEFANGTNWIQV